MKFMLLIYGNEENFSAIPPAEFEQIVRETDALNRQLSSRASSSFPDVADPLNAMVVQVADAGTTVTDGPYAEAKEYLGGFTIVDCDGERAVEIFALNPAARYVGVEIRPLMHEASLEM